MIGVPERLHTLVLFDIPTATGDAVNALSQGFSASGHYRIIATSHIEKLEYLLTTRQVDVIVSPDDSNALSVFREVVANARSLANRPIICLLTHHHTPPPETTPFDIVLPYISASFVEREVQRHLFFRDRFAEMQMEQDEVTLLKNAIVRNVSHELKTPLLQVKSAVALIAEDAADDKLSRMAVQATARLETVVKNITLLADSMNGNFGPVLVHESVDQAIRNLRRIWIHKDAISRIVVHIDDDLAPVMGDKQGLSIVLQQLMDNALKFSQDRVQVHIHQDDDTVHFSVRDSGIGIEPDNIKQIFESFYQIDSSSTRRYGGTGVGLAIVRLIMEKHGTEIYVDSTPGTGSTFSFSLPATDLG